MQTLYLNTCVIAPICALKALPFSARINVFNKIAHVLLSEVVSRIIAISTPLFAALDLLVITVSTVAIFTIIVITQIPQIFIGRASYQKSYQATSSLANQFFSKTKRCLLLGFLGPTAGFINPHFFNDFKNFNQPSNQIPIRPVLRTTFSPPNQIPIRPVPRTLFSPPNQISIRPVPRTLFSPPNQLPIRPVPRTLFSPPNQLRRQAAVDSRPLTQEDEASLRRQLTQNSQNLQAIERIWRSFAPSEDCPRKLFFAAFFDQGNAFSAIRERFASRAYKSLSLYDLNPKWLSVGETIQKVQQQMVRQNRLPRRFNPIFCEAFYYHATKEENFRQILIDQKIRVNAKVFKGAFVSTKPEPEYGDYIFALRKKIEQKTHLDTGFKPSGALNTYWAGIDKDIPVTKETLAYVIVNSSSFPGFQSSIESNCLAWTNRRITVISLAEVQPYLQAIAELNLGIPRHWPEYKTTRAAT